MPAPGQDVIQIEILEDGTIKMTSDAVSMPNHSSAENFLKNVAQLAGGETTRRRRLDVGSQHLQHAMAEHEKDGHTH